LNYSGQERGREAEVRADMETLRSCGFDRECDVRTEALLKQASLIRAGSDVMFCDPGSPTMRADIIGDSLIGYPAVSIRARYFLGYDGGRKLATGPGLSLPL
jgi:hypothetical protein